MTAAYPGISAFDFVKEVTTDKAYNWTEGCWEWCPEEVKSLKTEQQSAVRGQEPAVGSNEDRSRFTVHDSRLRIVAYDFGIKFNILRNLTEAGFQVTVVPAQTPAEAVLEMGPDGILLSNGPGDPETVTYAIENTRKLFGKKPIFGICLGHQILGLAIGGRTYKLKFGHHGGNHPVMDLKTRKVAITVQNHGFCVDIDSFINENESDD